MMDYVVDRLIEVRTKSGNEKKDGPEIALFESEKRRGRVESCKVSR